MGPRAALAADAWLLYSSVDEYNPYIRRLTDKYRNFIFLLLHILIVFLDEEPPKQAQYSIQETYPA
jgi:hypothetical protein